MSGEPKPQYGCSDYREEMRLMGLRRRLERDDLSEGERQELTKEVAAIEKRMGLD